MNSRWKEIEDSLLKVQNPSQYLGNEVNVIVKDRSAVDLTIALAFPDTYRIGMSHLGLQILYGVLNSQPHISAERVFAPWFDMEQLLRSRKIPLFSLETHTPLKEFDIIGFSLQYELCYTNVLNILSLAGIPLQRDERDNTHPLIIAGGPAAFNPEPMADFIDIFLLGDGEEKIIEFCNEYLQLQTKDRNEIIRNLAKKIPALYAPLLYEVSYHPDGRVAGITPKEPGIPETITKSVVTDLDKAYYPTKPIIPFAETVHDRINLEIMRGCPHTCRFCISSVVKSPVRYRSLEKLLTLAEEIYQNTGYDEISLLSLSSSDYPYLPELLARLNARFKSRKVNISLPSLRIDEQLSRLPEVIKAVRKSGLTLAPEAGRDGLRQIIDKPINDNHLYEAIKSAYQNGWNLIKLYFMIGLPGETEADIHGLAEMIKKTSYLGKEVKGQPGNINVTISPFTPKPHTPFQWEKMDSLEQLEAKKMLIKNLVTSRRIKLKFHSIERSLLEGVMARGDRRLGKVILTAWQSGARFDAWDEAFDFTRWQNAFQLNGLDMDFYARRPRPVGEVFPWAMIDSGISGAIFLRERNEAMEIIRGKT